MRIVCVDDARFQLLDDPGQSPRGGEVYFMCRRQRDQIESLRHPTKQLAVGMRHQRRPFSERTESEHRVHDLDLAATPLTTGIDVEGEHRVS